MKIPNEISSIISRIEQNEDAWKALYMAVWGFSYVLKNNYKNMWDKKISFGLPASKNRKHDYTPHQLYSIITDQDEEITMSHLQVLFSLFEELLNESSKILCFPEGLETYKWKDMKKFFSYSNTKNILSENELNELELAKRTRDCYVHNNKKVNRNWINAYKKLKGNCQLKNGDKVSLDLKGFFHQVEDWHGLVVYTTLKIKSVIENK